ncbi:MAG: hypothetical protein CME64_06240 [Halobacteriovoraceae bacterium]|nr:hypothetical protein [Halobacteriovoraceae bacterium]|tara:strand:- start:101321 stop:101743 length:423 start_codon:yes stop_codon:yes gene_type:complete
MEKFLVLISLIFASQAYSFSGQPKELLVMESMSQKTTLELNQIKTVNLNDCSKLAHFNPEATITAGRVTYKLAESYGSVKSGNCVQVLTGQPNQTGFLYLIYKEPQTGTRLTITFNSNQGPKVIFGYGKNKQSSKVLSTF